MVSAGKAIGSSVVTSSATRHRPGRDFSRPLLSAWQRSGQVVASTPSLLAHSRQRRCFADQHYASLPAQATGAADLLSLFPSPHRTAAKLRPIAAPA